jgi:transcriptional regulator with XRE-family HTH domain
MSSTIAVRFGDLLRRHRQAAGLTQEELAERAGLSRRGIADLERGARKNPHRDTVTLLADALGLPTEDRAALFAAARRSGTAPRLDVRQADVADGKISPQALPDRVSSLQGVSQSGAAAALPTGTPTFLFTDIAGSTDLLQRLGPAYARALDQHRVLLRAAFTAHHGHEVDTQGDAFFVAFPTAPEAVAAAAEVTRVLAGHAWPEGAAIQVRIGLHTGTPLGPV